MIMRHAQVALHLNWIITNAKYLNLCVDLVGTWRETGIPWSGPLLLVSKFEMCLDMPLLG